MFSIMRNPWQDSDEVTVKLWAADTMEWRTSEREYRKIAELNGVTFLHDEETGIMVADPYTFETKFLAGLR